MLVVICFFRAVAHQLYGEPNFHLNIRALGVYYLREHPERFIESNSENSWLEYLTNMSQQGTWCDNLIIQALADKLNVRIHSSQELPHNKLTMPCFRVLNTSYLYNSIFTTIILLIPFFLQQ